jgi:hypothetical protein
MKRHALIGLALIWMTAGFGHLSGVVNFLSTLTEWQSDSAKVVFVEDGASMTVCPPGTVQRTTPPCLLTKKNWIVIYPQE